MSYSVYHRCLECVEKEKCVDWQIIEGAVQTIHHLGENKGHLGTGSIAINCHFLKTKENSQDDIEEYINDKAVDSVQHIIRMFIFKKCEKKIDSGQGFSLENIYRIFYEWIKSVSEAPDITISKRIFRRRVEIEGFKSRRYCGLTFFRDLVLRD